MKKFIFILLSVTVLTSCVYANAKRYGVSSGIVEYKTSTKGNLLGFATNSEGSSKLYFKDYGNVELREETIHQGGNANHVKTKFVNGMVYTVDEKKKIIIKSDMQSMMGDKNMKAMGEDMLKQMGGKKIGKGKVLGYPCDIWTAMGSKMWFYKGVLLKLESSMLGIKTMQHATKVKFGVHVPSSKFALPNYPIHTLNEYIQEQTKSENSEKSSAPTPQVPKMEDVQKLMKGLGNMFGGH